MTSPAEPQPRDPHEVDPQRATRATLDRLVMDYPVEFDRLPDAMRDEPQPDNG